MPSLAVHPDDYAQAASIYSRASDEAEQAVTSLLRILDGCSAQMAGSDAGGIQWAGAYDKAVGEICTASSSVVTSLQKMGDLLHASGANHAAADASSVVGGAGSSAYPAAGGYLGSGELVCSPGPPPSASGGNTPEPDGWHWIRDLMEYTWPNGHQDKLHDAGAAWRTASATMTSAVGSTLPPAMSLIEAQTSPEVAAAVGYAQQVQAEVTNLASAYTSLGQACDGYADHLDQAHHTIIGALKSFVEWTIGLEVGGGLLSVVTLGISELAANGVVIARAAALAARVGGIIGDLIETVGGVVQTVVDVLAQIIAITQRLKTLLSLGAKMATTAVVDAIPGVAKLSELLSALKAGKTAVNVTDGVVDTQAALRLTKLTDGVVDAAKGADLTAADAAALRDYTSQAYKVLNGFLRDPGSVTPAARAALADRVAAITDALAKLPTQPGITWRGTTLPAKLLDAYEPGAIVSDKAFTSTSELLSVATKPPFEGNVVMRVIGQTGKNVTKFSTYPEAEVLYGPSTNFQVLSKVWDATAGKWNITVEEMP